MAQPLPAPLADYFAAANRHDIAGMLAPFASDASVRDEGQTHVGTEAIRAWLNHTTTKYRVTVDVLDITGAAEALAVIGRVSGNFPGSPANLTYRFTLADDTITSLAIG